MVQVSSSRRVRGASVALLLGVTVLAAVGLAGAASAQGQSPTSDQNVGIAKFAFSPPEQWVLGGKSIIWTNTDPVDHEVAAADGSWDSGTIASGSTFAFEFDTPGDYTYIDPLYPGMT